jgi:hypothetical protein
MALGDASTVGGGVSNTASSCYSFVGGGVQNTASACFSTVSGGNLNTASACYSTVSGGYENVASASHSIVAGGGQNASSAIYTVIGGGLGNRASSDFSTVGGGTGNTASGYHSTVVGGGFAEAYLTGQSSHASGCFTSGFVSDAQTSKLIARKEATLNSAGTSILYLDGTSAIILPTGNNRTWNVMVKWLITTRLVGTGTMAVGATKYAIDSFFFKELAGVGSISTQTRIVNQADANMADSDITYSVGGSNELVLTMTAPTSANGSTLRSVASLYIEELAW